MAHTQICPICKGKGELPVENTPETFPVPKIRSCYGCGGKGWVEVKNEIPYKDI